jgi:Zn-dependent protease
VLAFVFLLLYPIIYLIGWDLDIFLAICMNGFILNAWIGLFNMIPGGPFDGAKVLAWSTWVYAATVAVGVVMVFVLSRQSVFITVWGWMISVFAG